MTPDERMEHLREWSPEELAKRVVVLEELLKDIHNDHLCWECDTPHESRIFSALGGVYDRDVYGEYKEL